MYSPYTNEELGEEYCGQLDDITNPQYAYEHGITLYNMGVRYNIDDAEYAKIVVSWLRRYIAQEEKDLGCARQCGIVLAKLLSAYPQIQKELFPRCSEPITFLFATDPSLME